MFDYYPEDAGGGVDGGVYRGLGSEFGLNPTLNLNR